MTTDRALEIAEAALHEQRRREGCEETIQALGILGELRLEMRRFAGNTWPTPITGGAKWG